MPISAKYRFTSKSPVSFAFGPHISYLIQAKEIGSSSIDTTRLSMPENETISLEPYEYFNRDVTDRYKRIDFGISAQIDYQFFINSKINCLAFARFNCGLRDVMTDAILTYLLSNDWRNYSLLIGMGISF
jgi:hypothetical protein